MYLSGTEPFLKQIEKIVRGENKKQYHAQNSKDWLPKPAGPHCIKPKPVVFRQTVCEKKQAKNIFVCGEKDDNGVS